MTLIWKLSKLVGLLPVLAACLPVDERPPPGRAVVTVSTEQDLRDGLMTADGFGIQYERFLLSLGEVWLGGVLGGGRCDEYSQDMYIRILDLREPEPQTLSTLFALGDCVTQFALVSPSAVEFREGPGPELLTDVSEQDERFMRTVSSDDFASGAVVLSVAGTATRAGTTFSFDWSFRQPFNYEACETVRFEGDRSQMLEIEVQSRFLFHDRLAPETAQVLFQPYAAADANADAAITLEELGAVSIDDGSEFQSLAERLYLGLMPQLPWFQGRPACLWSEGSKTDRDVSGG